MPPAMPPESPTPEPVREYPVEELFRGADTVILHFRGQAYRLQVTRNDKLILTK